jgi:hypothetical protein
MAIQRRSIWCAGLSGLARSSNHTHETDRRNQMHQLPTTRREMVSCPLPARLYSQYPLPVMQQEGPVRIPLVHPF